MLEAPILIVDDDPNVLSTVADILEFEGYPVIRARNGEEGLECAQREPPRLVLLDMRMPVLDGWGFAQRLRERGQHLPIVVMTAAQDARRWAQEIGAAGYLAKPFDIATLLETIDRVVQ